LSFTLSSRNIGTVFEKDSGYILFIHRATNHYTLHESKEEIFQDSKLSG
jgi:hypothetical protein